MLISSIMEAKCSECNEIFPSKYLSIHFEKSHPNIFDVAYCCTQVNCIREYTDYNSFYKHALKCNRNLVNNVEKNTVNVTSSDVEMIEIARNDVSDDTINSVSEFSCQHEKQKFSDTNVDYTNPDNDNNDNTSTTNNSFFNNLLHFASDLYGDRKLTRSQAENILKNCSNLIVSSLFPFLLEFINNYVNDSSIKDKFSCKLQKFQLDFLHILTEAKMIAELRKKNYYIEHKEVTFKRDPTKNAPTNKKFHSKGYLIPLSPVLKNFFELPEVYNKTIEYISKLQNDNCNNRVSNIIQTNFWKNKIATNKNLTIPLILYEDEFECGNPIGSHKTINKMTGVYVSVACLPPEIFSKLLNIFLLQVYYSSDRDLSESKEIYKEIIKELNSLATKGIILNIDGKQINVNFQLAVVTGDNLGLNKILGFRTNFRINRNFCRFCKRLNNKKPYRYTLKKCVFRTIKNYAKDVALKDPVITGIKEMAVINEIKNFHVVNNPCVDVMHDILEGIARTEMAVILKKIIEYRVITLNDFNEKLQDFQLDDQFNKPPNVTQKELKKGIIKRTAAEMQFLILNVCILTGDLMESSLTSSNSSEYYDYWRLYIYLRKILCITLQTYVTLKDIQQIETLIREHHELLQKLNIKMTPKYHLLLHYPRIMNKVGPLRNIWCMRFESKHSSLKHFAIRSHNRKNLCKTIVSKEQLRLSNLFIQKKLFFISTVYEDSDELRIDKDILNLNLIDLENFQEILFLEINGITYQVGNMLRLDDNENPMFAEILHIFRRVSNEEKQPEFNFIVKLWKCNVVNELLQSYKLVERSSYKRLEYSSLLYIQPRFKIVINKKTYVTFDNYKY